MKHRTLSGAIAEHLREDILSGVYASGVQLRQDALAAMHNVSRIPVREALIQLEAEGLVRISPHKGAVVTSLTLEEINDVFDLRADLETRLFRPSIPLLEPEDFARIDGIRRQFSMAIGAGDSGRWGTLNAELHTALYARANLPRTASIVAGLLQTSDRYTRVQLSTPQAMKRAEREHAELIRMCKKRDVEGACALLVRHIEGVRTDLLRILAARPQKSADPKRKA